jgi:hypothetical protein
LDYIDADKDKGISNTRKTDVVYNYPNPFNPSTRIFYRLDRAENVNITIYDLLGREIRTLVNEKKEPGEYNVIFDSGNLSSGIYFYRAILSSNIYVKKLILQK